MNRVRAFCESICIVIFILAALACASMAIWCLLRIIAYTAIIALMGLGWLVAASILGALAMWLLEQRQQIEEPPEDDTFRVVWRNGK